MGGSLLRLRFSIFYEQVYCEREIVMVSDYLNPMDKCYRYALGGCTRNPTPLVSMDVLR